MNNDNYFMNFIMRTAHSEKKITPKNHYYLTLYFYFIFFSFIEKQNMYFKFITNFALLKYCLIPN